MDLITLTSFHYPQTCVIYYIHSQLCEYYHIASPSSSLYGRCPPQGNAGPRYLAIVQPWNISRTPPWYAPMHASIPNSRLDKIYIPYSSTSPSSLSSRSFSIFILFAGCSSPASTSSFLLFGLCVLPFSGWDWKPLVPFSWE